ncbi:MAG: hypothetical protein ACOYL6_18790 [Bacteriovoracaceae bacterium]
MVKTESSSVEKIVDPWQVLDNALKDKWDKTKLTKIFGNPNSKIFFQGSQFESYIYEDSSTGYQAWTYDFDSQDNITSIGYSPTSSGKTMFMDEIRKRWAYLTCFEKNEPVKTVPHVIRNQRYLSCESGKIKAYYSQYEEVQDIVVVK